MCIRSHITTAKDFRWLDFATELKADTFGDEHYVECKDVRKSMIHFDLPIQEDHDTLITLLREQVVDWFRFYGLFPEVRKSSPRNPVRQPSRETEKSTNHRPINPNDFVKN